MPELLYLGAGGGLTLVRSGRSARGIEASEAPLRRSDLPWLVAVVAFGGVAGPLLLMLGLARTPAASGSLLLNLEGLATMGIAWIVFRENVDRRLLLGAASILAGAVVLSWQGQGVRIDTGGLLIAAACLAWGIDNNLTRKLSSADPVTIALIKGLAAGSVNLILALLLGAHLPTADATGAAIVVGFLGVGVSLVLFVLALRHLGSARTGAYFSLAPFIGAATAVVLLGEPITAHKHPHYPDLCCLRRRRGRWSLRISDRRRGRTGPSRLPRTQRRPDPGPRHMPRLAVLGDCGSD